MKDMNESIHKLNYVLAMYDVRGKQNFIYRSTHIKEIIGGSDIIRTIFQRELYSVAKEYRNSEYTGNKDAEAIYAYHKSAGEQNAKSGTHVDESFKFSEFEKRMENPQYVGEVVYDGGGNFFILYKDEKTCKEITYLFTKSVLEKYITLKVVCTYISNLNPDRYHGTKDDPGDYERIYRQHRYTENEQLLTSPYGTLPIVQVDYLTSMPLTCFSYRSRKEEKKVKLTTESAAKYARYEELYNNQGSLNGVPIPNEEILDKIVTGKGEESLLAVIYMDGNNMGASIEKCLEGASGYDECVTRLRRFSADIQSVFIKKQADSFNSGSNKRMRLVIEAGDEVTVICNARDAYSVVKAYMEKLSNLNQERKDFNHIYSSCAGIAIFHSHAPYAEAYRIAEECCESAKAFMREKEIQNVCMMDYHYCQGAIGVSLKRIRRDERTQESTRPWLVADMREDEEKKDYNESKLVSRGQIMKMVRMLNVFGRSNMKDLNAAARMGNSTFELEVHRIEAHLSAYQKKLLACSECDMKTDIYANLDYARKMIEDISIVYDLWNDEWQNEIGWQEIVAKAENEGE